MILKPASIAGEIDLAKAAIRAGGRQRIVAVLRQPHNDPFQHTRQLHEAAAILGPLDKVCALMTTATPVISRGRAPNQLCVVLSMPISILSGNSANVQRIYNVSLFWPRRSLLSRNARNGGLLSLMAENAGTRGICAGAPQIRLIVD